MLCDDEFLYWKLPKGMGSALIKAVLQAVLSCKQDKRSHPERLQMTEYILLQFANEIANPLTKITEVQSDGLNKVFDAPTTEAKSSI